MEFIKKQVKGYKKSYTTAKGVKKNTKPNLTIYLGANTPFKPEQELILMDMELFNLLDSLLDLSNLNNNNIQDKINEFNQLQTIKSNYINNGLEIQELQDTIAKLNQELNNKNDEIQELNQDLHKHKNILLRESNKEKEYIKLLEYYKSIDNVRGTYGVLNRLRNKDPKEYIPRPETPLLTNENKQEQ